ncbi:MAG: histidine triad nucleotide-binding protein [Cryobacterium sp.]|nr:histidine triad nucleotide-binding protein [Oligoflexia bacterium]
MSGAVGSANCVFCKIIAGEIPSPRLFENERVIAIRDVHPQAKHHFLIIPKHHIASLTEAFNVEKEGRETLADLFEAASRVVTETGLDAEGFRSVINTGENGGQTVFHLHLHLLGGERLSGGFG